VNSLGLGKLQGFISEHKLASILIVGILVRLVLMPFSAHPFDVYVWYTYSMNILHDGPFAVQNFPPMWYHYLMVPVAYLYGWLSSIFSAGSIPMSSIPSALNFYPSFNIQLVPGLLFNFVVKLPFLISDVVITLLLYKIVEALTGNKGFAEKAALFWFLNPFVIWISAGWGMWDTLPALFSLAAFFFLLKKKLVLSSVSLSLGFVTKLYPVLFLLPIIVYFLKTNSLKDKWRNILKFNFVFLVTSAVLFLPSISKAGFILRRFALTSASVAGTSVDPVVKPVGYGLTYWSAYLLNRLFEIRISETIVTLLFALSWVLVALALMLVFWRITKLTFKSPFSDLALAMLSCVLVFFLSFRGICEQWFIWALPFLVIFCVRGQIKSTFYWFASIVALLYSVLNCPLPFFFLPLTPWIKNGLLGAVYALWAIEPARIIALVVLGCLFSFLILYILLTLWRTTKSS
jgi:hypothetical protein